MTSEADPALMRPPADSGGDTGFGRVTVPLALTHALTRLVTTGGDMGFVLLDGDGLISFVSPNALVPLGWTDHEALGLHWSTLIAPSETPLRTSDLVEVLQDLGLSVDGERASEVGGELGRGVVRVQTRTGRCRWVEVNVLDGSRDPMLDGYLIVARGVTGNRLAAEATTAAGVGPLDAAMERVAAVFAQVLDFDRLALSVIENDAFRIIALTGDGAPDARVGGSRPVHELTIRPLMDEGYQIVSDTSSAAAGDARAAKAGVQSYASALLSIAGRSVGALTWLSSSPDVFVTTDGPMLAEASRAAGVALLLLAQLEREKATSTELMQRTSGLIAQAAIDPLTGLMNRTRLREALSEALDSARARPADGGVGLLFCDLDRFKVVNDALGHHVGDTLLQQVAARLRHHAPKGSMVARLGGDEFVVLIPAGATNQVLLDTGVLLQRIVAEPIQVGHHQLRVDLSAGAVLATSRDTPDEVLQHADTAMYRAKSGGRHRVALWTEQVGAAAIARFDLERELAAALDADAPPERRITVVYQPVVDLISGRLHGVEALARWQHATLGAVPTQTFVTVAEEIGLSAALTASVGAQAMAAMASWRRHAAGRFLTIGLNISGRDLADPAVLAGLRRRAEASGLSPSQLMIELTETAIAQASDEAVVELRRFRDSGAHLALDDFGTGYSSLVHLRKLPVTTVKIDRSFVSGVGDDPSPTAGLADTGIVRAVAGLAISLGMNVIAEGVETARQRQQLLELSCTTGQGWLLGRPVPAGQIEAMVSGR